MTALARAALAALVTTALPALAAAEGNRLALACVPYDPAGTATEAPTATAFVFAPVKVDGAGAGRIEVTTPDGRTAPGVAASFQGPFAWTIDTTLNTLTVRGLKDDGRAYVLWHRLDQAQQDVPPAGDLTKLICGIS